MPYPALTFPELLEQSTRQELEQLVSLIYGWLAKQHKDDGSHSAITADSLTLNSRSADRVPTNVTGDLVPSVTATYSLGKQDTNPARKPIYAWKDAFVSGNLNLGSQSNIAGEDIAAWVDTGATGARTSLAQSTGASWKVKNSSGTTQLEISDVISPDFGVSPRTGISTPNFRSTGRAGADSGFWERSRTTAMGEWISVTFAAGNFTAGGSMTWTLASGDQVTFYYTLVGKTMTVAWVLNTTTVGGTVSANLRIAIPGGFVAARQMDGTFNYYDNGTPGVGLCRVTAAGTVIDLYQSMAAPNWTLSTDNTYVTGTFSFEIQ